jgi:hypothetical protein
MRLVFRALVLCWRRTKNQEPRTENRATMNDEAYNLQSAIVILRGLGYGLYILPAPNI